MNRYRHADSTLKSMTKDELIRYVRTCEHNRDTMEETLEQQAKNFEMVCKDWENTKEKLNKIISYNIKTTRISTFLDMVKDGTFLNITDVGNNNFFDGVYYKNKPDDIMFDLYNCDYIIKRLSVVGSCLMVELEESERYKED